ncbi:MAG: hypothetical protein AAF587_08915 [Bacteroidota bacterium]
MMKRFYVPICLALAITGILLGNSCTTAGVTRRNIICLLDYSGSIGETQLAQYADIITEDIFLALGVYDRLVVLPIDQASRIEPIKIFYEDLQQQVFTRAGDGLTHAQDSLDHRKQRYLLLRSGQVGKSILEHRQERSSFADMTDIFSALEEVARLQESTSLDPWGKVQNFMHSKPNIQLENIFIIFSDMIHESEDYSLDNNHEPSYYQHILTELEAANRIPNLTNSKVLVHGRTGKTTQQVENLLRFWTAYFRAANADLVAYEFDSRSWINQVMQ